MPETKGSAFHFYIKEKHGVTRESVIAFCQKWNAVLAVKEEREPNKPGPNPHYHVAFRTPREYTGKAIRDAVRKLFTEPHEPKDFGTHSWDEDDRILAYFCKGPGWAAKQKSQPPDVVFTTLAPGTIKEFHESFWKQNEISGEKIKRNKEDLITEVYEKVKSKNIKNWFEALEEVTGQFMEELSGKVNDNVLFPLVQSVMFKLDSSRTNSYAYDRMLKKFGPRANIQNGQMGFEISPPE